MQICKSIVELHHGTITVNSAGENHGSTFTVTLPLVPLSEASNIVSPQLTTSTYASPQAESQKRELKFSDMHQSNTVSFSLLGASATERCLPADTTESALTVASASAAAAAAAAPITQSSQRTPVPADLEVLTPSPAAVYIAADHQPRPLLPSSPSCTSEACPKQWQQLCVLLAEDSPPSLKLLHRILVRFGFGIVLTAKSVYEAIEQMNAMQQKQTHIDLLISDIGMISVSRVSVAVDGSFIL